MTDSNFRLSAKGPSRPFRVILACQAFLAFVTLVVGLLAWFKQIANPMHLWVGIGFSLVITITDLIWYARVIQLASRQDVETEETVFRPWDRTLLRSQTLAASLIYHSAALPFLWLAKRAAMVLTARSFLLMHVALLVMGAIPILSIAYLDRLQPPIKH